MEPKADIAVIGLAVMGQNLILNMNDHGFTVVAFNRTVSKVDDFLNKEAKGTKVIGAHSIEEMVALLKKPRRVMLMVKAGKPVDEFIEQLLPHLEAGDIIIDGGNSLFEDTIRRTKYVESKGLLYIGTGVSGGEEGARRGPSIMPGGSPAAWPHVKDIFQTIAAKVDDGSPCCDWVGENGAGHYVKMVHNGIEYGDMQLICEAYNLMKTGLGMSADADAPGLRRMEQGRTQLLPDRDHPRHPGLQGHRRPAARGQDPRHRRPEGHRQMDGHVLAGPGHPHHPDRRSRLCPLHLRPQGRARGCRQEAQRPQARRSRATRSKLIEDIRQALYASKIVSYAQGYMLMRAAAKEYELEPQLRRHRPHVARRLHHPQRVPGQDQGSLRQEPEASPTCCSIRSSGRRSRTRSARGARSWPLAARKGIPVPAFSTALAFYDGYRSERLPANLLQAQRDYFGAHTYERVDQPRGQFFHTNWTGRGGTTASSTYTV